MNKLLKTLTIVICYGILLSSCAKNNTYDSLQDLVQKQKIIGNYYTQDFENHETSKLHLSNYAPRQQRKYLNLKFQTDNTIIIENIDLNFNTDKKIDGHFILQNGTWELVKDNIYRISFKGIYFAEGTFITEGDYELIETTDNNKELILIKRYKNIREDNGIF